MVTRRIWLALFWLAAVRLSSSAQADGGKLQLSERAGPYQVSVFTTPTPIRVGKVDVSVLVQDAQAHDVISKARVMLRADPEHAQGHSHPIVAQATHATATNRLLQAAYLDLPHAGSWKINLTVEAGGQQFEFQLPINVAPPLPPWKALLPWLTLPAWAILLFFLDHFLRPRGQVRPQN